MSNEILLPILYAGLAGVLLALIFATARQNWSLRVFFLLALRLAVGWHFLFEGLHKVESHYGHPVEGVRPFSSEPYFKVAPGPLGSIMRKQFADPEAVISAKAKPTQNVTPADFAKLPDEEQAKACPEAVARELDVPVEQVEEAIKAEAAAETKAADAAEKKGLEAADAAEKGELEKAKTEDDKARIRAKTAADKAKVKEQADKARQAAKEKADAAKELAPRRVTAAKAAYARWVYGVDGRDTKLKGITGEVAMTAPERIAHIDRLKKQLQDEEARQSVGLGNGYGIDQKRAAELRMDVVTAESDFARDIDAFIAELRKALIGDKAAEQAAETTRGQLMDKVTMWFIVAVGGCLLAGLFTRIACVLGTAFLVLTYLTHPPFPWFPLPPNTEGNPVFINKNVIEGLALLVLATFPTGRWLGLDALLSRVCCRGRSESPTV